MVFWLVSTPLEFVTSAPNFDRHLSSCSQVPWTVCHFITFDLPWHALEWSFERPMNHFNGILPTEVKRWINGGQVNCYGMWMKVLRITRCNIFHSICSKIAHHAVFTAIKVYWLKFTDDVLVLIAKFGNF